MKDREAPGWEVAIGSVAATAARQRPESAARLARVGLGPGAARRARDAIRQSARLTVNFHPDRRDSTGRTVAAGLFEDGRYRSQFETGISNGGRTAVAGGDRSRWESMLFDGAYDDGAPIRPVYGSLDLFGDPYGGAPRFGSSFLVLEQSCLARATFCMGDSHLGPKDVGTIDQFEPVLAGAAEQCASGHGFGRELSVGELLDTIEHAHRGQRSARVLDHYVEAQVHGPVDLERDVSAIHLDPSFRGTTVGEDLEAAARRYGFALAWSEGSEVRPADIDPGFRGPEIVALAERTARQDGWVDAAAIGQALFAVPYTSPSIEGDAESSPRQRYKKLWHCCLEFGSPPEERGWTTFR